MHEKAWLGLMSAVGTVLKEHLKNFYLIQRLAQFQIKISNHSNYLGMAWEILNPALQIMVYWLVFGLELEVMHQYMVSHLYFGC